MINKFFKKASILLTALSIIYVVFVGYQNWIDLREVVNTEGLLFVILIGSGLYGLNLFLLPFAWQKVIKIIGENLSYALSAKIYGQSQIAKYLPGNLFHYLGRHLLGRQAGLSNSIIVSSIIIETLLITITAIFLGSITVYFYGWLDVINFYRLAVFLVVLGVFCFCLYHICISHKFKKWLFIQNWFESINMVFNRRAILPLVSLIVYYVLFFAVIGLILWLMASHFWRLDIIPLIFVGAYSISWVMGFITPGAPGGVGVREALLIIILSPYMLETYALTLALVLRVITVLGDILFFNMTFFIKSRVNSKSLEDNSI